MKKLEDYLYYEEKDPDMKIYCGELMASWYNKLITRRPLWGKKRVTNRHQSILKNVKESEAKIIYGLAIKSQLRVGGLEPYDCIKILENAQFAKSQKLNGIILTEIQQITTPQISKSLAENVTWLWMEGSQSFKKWHKEIRVYLGEWLQEKVRSRGHIVKGAICFLERINRGLGYVGFAQRFTN